MKTPEVISAERAGQAVADILERRRTIGDPHLDEFIAAAHDARELIRVVLKRRRGLPDWVAEADVHDVLVLHVRQYWEWLADDLAVLEQAERLAMNRKEVGDLLNLGSGQAIVDRITARRRQMALLRGEPDPAELATPPAEAERAVQQRRWLGQHRGEISALVDVFLDHQNLASDEAAEWLIEVRRDHEDGARTPAGMTVLAYAAAELAASPAVRHLPEAHPLQAALVEWHALTDSYPGNTHVIPTADDLVVYGDAHDHDPRHVARS